MQYCAKTGTATGYPPHFNGLLFGTTSETYLAHKLAKADHWDEAITVTGLATEQATLDTVTLVTVPELRDKLQEGVPLNQQKSPFTENTTYKGTLTPNGDTSIQIAFTAGKQRWWNSTSLNT